jgi:hypothetical protein
MTPQFTLEAFEANKETIELAISNALSSAVAEAGEDIRFIPWFTAASDFHEEVAAALAQQPMELAV